MKIFQKIIVIAMSIQLVLSLPMLFFWFGFVPYSEFAISIRPLIILSYIIYTVAISIILIIYTMANLFSNYEIVKKELD
jgi:hypothetical protein